jgi:lycopene elongase/hydratase (flavuxanthin-forming)
MEMTEISAALPGSRSASPRAGDFTFLLQVSRPGLWTTTSLFYLMPLGRDVPFHSTQFWLGLLYILFPLGLLLYGVNDIVDAETDRLNPRKGTFLFGARGGNEQLSALRWKIAAVQLPFLAAFYFLIGPRVLWWLVVLLLAVLVYNGRPFAWKGRPPFDVLTQASYLLVFVLSSWLNEAPQLPWQTFLFGAMFAMHSHVFGEVMDIDPDRLSDRRTTAGLIGRRPAKLLIAAFLAAECILVAMNFADWAIVVFLALGSLWFIFDVFFLWKARNYSPLEMRAFMFGWNAVAVLGMLWNWRHGTLTHVRHIARLQG